MAGECCYSFTGIPNDCGANIGGIVRAWGACHSDAGKPTITDNMVSAIPNPTAWSLFEFQRQTGSLTSTFSDNTAASSKLVSSVLVFQFAKMETTKRLAVTAIALGVTDWIIEDNNGKYWYVGYDFGATLSDGTGETGTSYEDVNAYNVTLTAILKSLPYEVSEAAMEPLLDESEEP